MSCAKLFGALLELADIDLSICQEAITVGTTARLLHTLMPDVVALGITTIDTPSLIWNIRDCNTLAYNQYTPIWNVRVCDTVLRIGILCVEILPRVSLIPGIERHSVSMGV